MPNFGPHPKQLSTAGASSADARVRAGTSGPLWSEVGLVPIGGCIPWWPVVAGSPQPPLPFGWEYADGGTVSTPNSPAFGLTKPALMATVENPGTTNRFIRGANTTIAFGGAVPLLSGGTTTHSHGGATLGSGGHGHNISTNNTGQHTHNANVGGLSVSGNTGNAGGHSHGVTGGSSVNTFNPLGAIQGVSDHSHGSGNLQTAGTNISTNNQGNHSHGGSTNNISNHVHTVNSDGTLPNYIELAYIVRVL